MFELNIGCLYIFCNIVELIKVGNGVCYGKVIAEIKLLLAVSSFFTNFVRLSGIMV